MGFSEGKERDKVTENPFQEIIAEDFPNLVKETSIKVQEAQIFKQDEPRDSHQDTL